MSTTASSGLHPRSRPGRRAGRRWAGYGFVGPFLAVFALVFLAPIGYALHLSLFRDRLVGGNAFVGLDNYVAVAQDSRFWSGLARVGLFLVVQVPIMILIALAVALALDSGRLPAARVFRIAIFLPYAVPAVVATLMWGFIYGPRYGLVGTLNERFDLSLPDPFSSSWVLASIGNVVTWEFVGYNMLILYAALRVVPRTLYEAAAIDGAGPWRTALAIKIPSIRGALVVAVIFSIIGSFQLFNEPNVLQALTPNTISTSYTPNMYAYSLSFSGQQYNYAAAVAIVVGLLTMVVAYTVQVRGIREEGGS